MRRAAALTSKLLTFSRQQVIERNTFALGAVVMSSWEYSRSSRSWMISMCSSPRKPQRNPNPSASEVSGSN